MQINFSAAFNTAITAKISNDGNPRKQDRCGLIGWMAKAVAQGLAQHKPLFFFETDRACDIVDYLEAIHRNLNIIPIGDAKPALKRFCFDDQRRCAFGWT